jgi:hypothetical protein
MDEESKQKEYVNNMMSVFVMVKLRIPRKKEFEGDFEGFRFHYKRQIQKGLSEVGDVKHIDIVT